MKPTPFMLWRERHVIFYMQGAEDDDGETKGETYKRLRALFDKIKQQFAQMLGLHTRKVKLRKIGSCCAIYISKRDWEKRREDFRPYMFPTEKHYSCYLSGLMDAHWKK